MKKNKNHKRTPAPWYFKKRGWMGGGPFVTGPAQRMVADCDLDDVEGTYRRIENMQNAKFIAQTPKMLDLLYKAQLLLEFSNGALDHEEYGLLDTEKWNKEFEKILSRISNTD